MDDAEIRTWTDTTNIESERKTQRVANIDSAGNLAVAGEKANGLGSAMEAETPGCDSKEEENHEYITGLRLFAVLASVTLAAFLMLLDGSIIGVVSRHKRRRSL